jgi:hypothetical protein
MKKIKTIMMPIMKMKTLKNISNHNFKMKNNKLVVISIKTMKIKILVFLIFLNTSRNFLSIKYLNKKFSIMIKILQILNIFRSRFKNFKKIID